MPRDPAPGPASLGGTLLLRPRPPSGTHRKHGKESIYKGVIQFKCCTVLPELPPPFPKRRRPPRSARAGTCGSTLGTAGFAPHDLQPRPRPSPRSHMTSPFALPEMEQAGKVRRIFRLHEMQAVELPSLRRRLRGGDRGVWQPELSSTGLRTTGSISRGHAEAGNLIAPRPRTWWSFR